MPEDKGRRFFDYCPHLMDPDDCTVCGDERGYIITRERKERIDKALEYIVRYGWNDGDHHKAWVIDQVVRALTGCPMVEKSKGGHTYEVQGESEEYLEWVRETKDGEDGPDTYSWDIGIPP